MLTDIDRKKRVVRVAVMLSMAITCGAWGKVIYVDDDALAPGDGSSWQTAYKFLQDALTDAKTAEKPVEIRVARGVYKPDRDSAYPQGTGDRGAFLWLSDGMSLLGGYAGLSALDPDARDIKAYQTVLSGDLLGNDAPVTDASMLQNDPTRDDNSEVMKITCGEVRLEGCTITGGGLGALSVAGIPPSPDSTVRISDCTFRGNRGSGGDAPSAGAVGVVALVDVAFTRCSFIGNAGVDGAMRGTGTTRNREITLDSCQFARNYGWGFLGGGAAHLNHSTIVNCTFTDNRAAGSGGALSLNNSPFRGNTVVGCVFRRNRAAYGGALVCRGDMELRDCLFVGNEAATIGGVGLHTGGDVVLANCVLAGNRSGERGGAWVSGSRSLLRAISCTIVDNRSPEGSFLDVNHYSGVFPNPITVSNCVLSNEGDEIQSSNVPVKITYTCVPDGSGAFNRQEHWLAWGPGNIVADPCFADAGYWDPNGTPDDPNDDFFVEGDYHLKSQAGRWDPISESWAKDDVTSPCIDAGDPNSPIGQEPFPNGGRVNMGAYGGTTEASKSYFGGPVCETIMAGDINGDCRVDFRDLALMVEHWLWNGVQKQE